MSDQYCGRGLPSACVLLAKIKPKDGCKQWEQKESFHANFRNRDQVVDQIAHDYRYKRGCYQDRFLHTAPSFPVCLSLCLYVYFIIGSCLFQCLIKLPKTSSDTIRIKETNDDAPCIFRRSMVHYTGQIRRCGEIGRRSRLKICRWKHRTGSIPVTGTKNPQARGAAGFFVALREETGGETSRKGGPWTKRPIPGPSPEQAFAPPAVRKWIERYALHTKRNARTHRAVFIRQKQLQWCELL